MPVESIAMERKYCFCKQGEITPLLQKAIPEIEKLKDLSACNAQAVKHNAQKIIKIKKNHKFELFLSCNAKEKTNA